MIPKEEFDGLVERLKLEEGFSATAFWDDAPGGGKGQWTFGYGTRAPGEGATITPIRAEYELRAKLLVAEKAYHKVFDAAPFPINAVRRDALIDMIFNLGETRFRGFRQMIAEIMDDDPNDWVAVAAEAADSVWWKQLGGDDPRRGRGERAKRIVAELATGLIQDNEKGDTTCTDLHR